MTTIEIRLMEHGQPVGREVFTGEQIAGATFVCRDQTEWTTVYRRADGKLVLENGTSSHWAKEVKTGRFVRVEIIEEDDLKRWLELYAGEVIALKISDQLGLGISPDNWS